MGQTPKFDIELDTRFDWGGVQLLLSLDEGRIAHAGVYSDAMDAELPAQLRGLLEGLRFGSGPMAEALRFSENPQIQDVARWSEKEPL